MRVADVIAAARACDRTPFHHQGRQPGVGLDCAGLIIHAFAAAGGHVTDRKAYRREPDPPAMRATLEEVLVHIDRDAPWHPGDVLWMKIVTDPQHLALLTDTGTIWHAYSTVGRVLEQRLDERWRRRVLAVYRHPEICHEQ